MRLLIGGKRITDASKNRTWRDFERALDALRNGMNGCLLRGFGSWSAMQCTVLYNERPEAARFTPGRCSRVRRMRLSMNGDFCIHIKVKGKGSGFI